MDILIVSTEDMCRSRMAQAILLSLGRGMKIFTAGVAEGSALPDIVRQVMQQEGYELAGKRPTSLSVYASQPWDVLITLSKEAEEECRICAVKAKDEFHLAFDDALCGRTDEEHEVNIRRLYDEMLRSLYELYRDELSEKLMPACTCGANTYCRCE